LRFKENQVSAHSATPLAVFDAQISIQHEKSRDSTFAESLLKQQINNN